MSPRDLRMMHLSGVAGIIGLTLVAYGVCVHPILREYAAEREARSQSVFVEEDLLKIRSEIEAASLRDAGLQSQADQQFAHDPASMLNDKIERLTSLAERCGVNVSRLRPGDPVKRTMLTDVPLNISGECDYQSFHALLALMRVESPDVEVESFDLSTEGAAGSGFRARMIWHACNDLKSAAAEKADGTP